MRRDNWQSLLLNYLSDMQSVDFKWGVHDCLIFTSDWALIACGVDPMHHETEGDIRGQYKSQRKAKRLISELRGDLPDIMDKHFKRVSSHKAQRGDIVLKDIESGLTFGIVGMDGKAHFLGEANDLVVHNKLNSIAWRVE